MNKVIIKSIEIKNFKGIASFKTEFNEDITRFYGANGSGKSTIKNAWEWALCRNVSDYLPNLNNQEVPNLITSVEVKILVNDLEYILRRESKPKYGKNKEKTGNEATYSIDGIEVGQKQYQSQIANIIGDVDFEKLPMLTDKEFFNTDTTTWKWVNRRKILLSMTGAEEEANKLAEDEKYAIIRDYIKKGYSTSDVKSTLVKDCNTLKKNQQANLVLIESKEKEIDEYLGIDFDKVSQELGLARAKYTKLLNSSDNQLLTETLKRIDEDILKYSQELSSLKTRDVIKKRDLEDFKLKIYQEAIDTKYEYDSCVRCINRNKKELELLEKEKVKDVCSLCGQKLPEELFKTINEDVSRKLNLLNTEIEQCKKDAKDLYEKYNNLQKQYAEQEDKINNFVPNERINELETLIFDLNSKSRAEKDNSASNLSTQQQKGLEERISFLEKEMAKKDFLEKAHKQVKLWKEDNLKIADEIIQIENKEIALQNFVREQTEIISQTVNSYFGNGVSWSLYTINYSGGLEECCECMYNDKLYSCLSTGEKNKTNIEVVKSLQNFYEVNIPIFCDNHETVTLEYETDRQVIELYAKSDAKLDGCIKITDLDLEEL